MISKLTISVALCLAPAPAATAADNYRTSAEAYAAAKSARGRVAESDNCITDVHRRNNANNTRTLEEVGKLRQLYKDKKKALDDLATGMYCSQCMRTKTEIEAGRESFEGHLRRVKGRPVPASAKQIADKAKEFDQKIKELRERIQNNDTHVKLVREYNVCSQKRQQAYNDYNFAVILGNYLRGQEQWRAARERLKREQEAREKYLAAIEAGRAAEYERIKARVEAEMMRSLARADRDYGRENEERARKIEWALRQRLDQERQAAERTRAAREEYNKWAYPPGTPDPSPPGPGPGHQSPPPSVAYDVNEQLAKLLNANGNAPDVRPNGDNVFRQVGQDGKPTFEILYQSPNWPTQYHRVVVFAGGRSTSYSPPGSTWPPPEQNDSADSRSGDNTGGRNQGGRNQRGAGNDGGAGTGNDSANGGRSGGGNSGSVYYGGGGRSNPDNTHVFGYASSASDQTAKKSAYNLCSAQGRNCRLDRLIMSHPGYYGAIVVDAANGAYGYAPDYPTQRAATDSARSRCYAAGGKNCSFEITVPPNSWGAVYKGDK